MFHACNTEQLGMGLHGTRQTMTALALKNSVQLKIFTEQKIAQPTYTCITDISMGISFCPYSKDCHRTINKGQKVHEIKKFAWGKKGENSGHMLLQSDIWALTVGYFFKRSSCIALKCEYSLCKDSLSPLGRVTCKII